MNQGEKKAEREKVACVIHGVEYVISSHKENLRVEELIANNPRKETILILESTVDYLKAYKKLLLVRYNNVGNE